MNGRRVPGRGATSLEQSVDQTDPQEAKIPGKGRRNWAQGLRAMAVLGILSGASLAAGLVMAGRLSDVSMEMTEASAAPMPPLAARLVTAADFIDPPAQLIREAGSLQRNETLTGLLLRLGASPGDANSAVRVAEQTGRIDTRRLAPGRTQAEIFLEEQGQLTALTVRASTDSSVLVTRSRDGGWLAAPLDARLTPGYRLISATIETSIYNAAIAQGASDQQVAEYAAAFAYDIDFQRQIHPGDEFEILFETFYDERGQPVRNGTVLYAALHGRALDRGFYRFTPSDDGVSDYFDQDGESATRFLMKTPINGARISSPFGTRRHPISGFTRLHRGTDFAAPTGTPIYAAGNGTVQRASWNGGYGHYIRIRHGRGYETAYAHLSRYARGIRPGVRVRQGDTIGFVGSTGASTGPHLHYEVWVDGKPVNAMSLNLPTGRKLAQDPEIYEEFLTHKAGIDALREASASPRIVAAVNPGLPGAR
jgi:murein DD-endopeptidase MepM/ murein hydrolase activator NlpD